MKNVDKFHWVPVLYPVADGFAGTVNTDIVRVDGEGMLWHITKGVGATGTSTIVVQACDTVGPANVAAVAFMYRISTTPDIWGDWTQATVTGFTTTAGSNQMYQIYVDAAELASEGYAYARLNMVEVVANAVLGGVNAAVVTPNYVVVPATLLT